MASELVLTLGRIIIVIGAALELRHLLTAVWKKFEGCTDLRSAVDRALRLDDVTAVGIAVCVLLAAAIVVTIGSEFGLLAGMSASHETEQTSSASISIASRG